MDRHAGFRPTVQVVDDAHFGALQHLVRRGRCLLGFFLREGLLTFILRSLDRVGPTGHRRGGGAIPPHQLPGLLRAKAQASSQMFILFFME